MIRITKILYPTDFSSYSNQAYFHAIAQAEKHQAALTIVFVWNPETGRAPARNGESHNSTSPRDPHAEEADRNSWRQQLEQIRPLDGNIAIQHVLLCGDPAVEIVRYARESGSDLIVMGTHGRTGRDRQLLGSVAEQVLRDAHCSVLVVKLPRRPVGKDQESRAAAP